MLAIVSTRQLGRFIPAPTMQTWKSTFGLVMFVQLRRYRKDSTTEEKVETSEHDVHEKALIIYILLHRREFRHSQIPAGG
jgi:hypothetical protein